MLDPLVVHHWVIFSSVDGSGEVPLCAFVLVPPWCALNLLQCVTTATFQSDVYFWGIDEVIGRQIWWMRQVVSLDCVSVCVFSHAWWHADMNHSSSHLGHNRHFRMLQMKYMLTVSPRGTNSKCTFCECWKKIISMLLVSRLTRWWVWSLNWQLLKTSLLDTQKNCDFSSLCKNRISRMWSKSRSCIESGLEVNKMMTLKRRLTTFKSA